MGKGFQNFMSKKDFHPSAIWNIKKVWIAEQKEAQDKKRQEDMRAQYEKEQEMINNKALLGDEKAKVGLAFMYDAPAGLREDGEKLTEAKEEPKFDWQRKFNAPRESWAKGDENVQDQPFGIAVRNTRCCKCHKYGHMNTDSECPLYNMSGNFEDAGYSTNPSDLIKQLRDKKQKEPEIKPSPKTTVPEAVEPSSSKASKSHSTKWLNNAMGEEYGLTLKHQAMENVRSEEALTKLEKRKRKAEQKKSEDELMAVFLQTLTDKERAKIFRKFEKACAGETKKSKKGRKDRKRDSSSNSDSGPSPGKRKRPDNQSTRVREARRRSRSCSPRSRNQHRDRSSYNNRRRSRSRSRERR